MGEILRAVLDKSALIARPRWYVADLPYQTYVAGAPISGTVHIQANTNFLWTTFGFSHHGAGAQLGLNDFGDTAQVEFRQLESGKFYQQGKTLASNIQSYQTGQMELEDYPLFPGDFRLGFIVTPITVSDADAYYLTFGGIEYLMPKSQADYGVGGMGG